MNIRTVIKYNEREYIGMWADVSQYQYIMLKQIVDDIPNTKFSSDFTFVFKDENDVIHLFTKEMFENSDIKLEIERN